ncbi:MAG: T9SS type A sorting domain-containing protein [Cyclobacteriaceae bacterium]|nr:T9SS type A sorting domain-containing protein [Cyclobacteriaceae bacterium]
MGKIFLGLGLSFFLTFSIQAQVQDRLPAQASISPPFDIVCYSRAENMGTVIPPPEAYEKWKSNKHAKTNSTAFEVTYIGFSPEAQVAFQKAVDIWASLIETEVPVRIRAVWQPITDSNGSTNSVLGGASPGTYIRDFDGAQKVLTWYPVALAEKMAKKEFNDADPDIFAQFNSSFSNWYFGTDGIPQPGKTDFTTVVLHEIGHGLGITKGYNVNGDNGEISSFFSNLHVIYDHFIENNNDENLVQNFFLPSTTLKTQLTTSPLWFKTPQLNKNGAVNNRAQLFAPSPFQSGSSIAHLDELTYNGTENALMTPQIGNAEVHLNPGTIVMKMLADMGWVHTQIIHSRLKNTENVSTNFEVKVQLVADNLNSYNYNPGEVKLTYTINGTTLTTVAMTGTGVANEFAASIPATGSATNYGYFISVVDNLNRTIRKPGVYAEDGKVPVNRFFVFEAGPDTKGPFFSHSPVAFVKSSDSDFEVSAIVSDNIAVANVFVDYKITKSGVTGSLQTLPMNLVTGTDSTYSQKISYVGLGLANGDKIEYRIRAIDQANTPNTASIPKVSPGFYPVNVVSLASTQDSYSNNFDNITASSQDFFGSQEFSIRVEAGFSTGAIHTNHPYPEGQGSPNNRFEWVYQLRVPIRVKEVDATVKFDEVVLVEPGETGSTFPSEDFYDYVVVDGSKDGGITWTTIANGYDSRDFTPWLTRYNSSISNNISTAVGDPSLFRARLMNLQDKFDTNDEVVIRFRLFSDPGAAGWGWVIDNLRIQIDDTPPTVLHDHADYVVLGTETLPIVIKPSDASGVDKLFVDIKLNGGAITTEEVPITEGVTQYTLIQPLAGLVANDLIEYQIRCLDMVGNQTTVPAGFFFKVPIINLGAPVTQYVADFNSSNLDFVGNFFSVSQPLGFSNGAIHSMHPYPTGFGITNSISNYTYTLTKPITISATNPFMLFDEIVLVEYSGASIKDFVVIEGSKDNGATWESFLDPYTSLGNPNWKSNYDLGGSGSPSLYRTRLLNLTSSGKFVAGQSALIRFRLASDSEKNGWGWAIDNLSIQGPVTGVEQQSVSLSVYPNPSVQGRVSIEIGESDISGNAQLQVINALGGAIANQPISLTSETTKIDLLISDWAEGIYYIRLLINDGTSITGKFVKSSN